ncbi:MAG: hypothetical protein GXP15_00425 [Gammaproteobacteria bacterium]|nr:hypothetical protein [Gammaproteobacteria bacterium]
MPFVIPSVLRNTFSSRNNRCRDASGMRAAPELVVLDVVEGVTPSPKPPVRIFLGTEPAHYRAERIFVWSIERVRDPARVYEIHLMKELAGFDRRRWLTGFTNYRFAIPHFAQGSGRAIWNDVDQAYLADPAELFDTDMGECGLLTVPPLSSSALLDTAVMLIDCERMASIWTGDEAKHGRKNNLLAKVQARPGLRGDLPGEWNARDEEYVPGRSKLLHWTILHTQPWHPLPQAFVYQRNPVGHVWYDMERSANLAGYHVFTADKPSAQFKSLLTRIQAGVTDGKNDRRLGDHPPAPTTKIEGLDSLIEKTASKSLLDYCFADVAVEHSALNELLTEQDGIAVTRYDPADPSYNARPTAGFDGVVCADALNYIPDEDIPWVINDLFECAKQFVYVAIEHSSRGKMLADGTSLCSRQREPAWWKAAFESAAERHPQIQWKLVFNQPADAGAPALREIGWSGDQLPRVWVLNDNVSVDTSQSTALAEALGWPFEVVDSPFDSRRERPDLVIAANQHTGSWARRLCRQSGGRTRCVRIDGTGGAVAKDFDAVVSPAYFHLPPHPHRIESVTQLTRITPERLARARDRCPRLFGLAPHPRIVVLLGASESSGPPDTITSRRLGEEIRTFATLAGGSVFALISRRITPGLAGALVAGLGESPHVHTWSPDHRDDDTYLAYLELADTIIVTGDDEFLMADAAATGKSVYVYPLAERPANLSSRFRETVFARSQARPLNKRGTVRPQQGLEYFCARLIERGIVLPPHDLNALRQSLVRLGVIHQFGTSMTATSPHAGLRVAHDAARQVQRLLGLGEHARLPQNDLVHTTDWTQHVAAHP